MRETMQKAKTLLRTLHVEEGGQDLIEYGLIAALIALGAVAGMSTLANQINTTFNAIGTKLSSYVS